MKSSLFIATLAGFVVQSLVSSPFDDEDLYDLLGYPNPHTQLYGQLSNCPAHIIFNNNTKEKTSAYHLLALSKKCQKIKTLLENSEDAEVPELHLPINDEEFDAISPYIFNFKQENKKRFSTFIRACNAAKTLDMNRSKKIIEQELSEFLENSFHAFQNFLKENQNAKKGRDFF